MIRKPNYTIQCQRSWHSSFIHLSFNWWR